MFNFFKSRKNQSQHIFFGNRGYLSLYGIEDIYNFIGEERMNQRITELGTKATMGIRLEELVHGTGKEGFYNKGPIDCMAIIEFLFHNLFTRTLHLKVFA